jgi:hypothetical protein
MAESVYALFIEDCRQQRASLLGLIEALKTRRLNPGEPIDIPEPMIAATAATLVTFQRAIALLNVLIDTYDDMPDRHIAAKREAL